MDFLRIKRAAEAVNPQQLAMGKRVELEHGTKNPATNVTDDDPKMTEQIARAHLKEDPAYYTHLKAMENKYVEKKANGDEAGNPIDEAGVRQWLKNNPNPEDSAVHQYAEENGYNKHALEELVYRWASEHVKESAYREGVLRAMWEAGLLQ